MTFALFYHSLRSEWNHGRAHFLRGVAWELMRRGCDVRVFEPEDGWSRTQLLAEQGPPAQWAYRLFYPGLESQLYRLESLALERELEDVDVVIAHEWNAPELVRRLGGVRAGGHRFRLFFHDTHHRAVTAPEEAARYELVDFDGVLARGDVLRDRYLERGWARAAWTWHEAADTARFFPGSDRTGEADLAWVGNWADDGHTRELAEFVFGPVQALRLRASAWGAGYPQPALHALEDAGIHYRGWLPNPRVPAMFDRHAFTVHVPRSRRAEALPGVPGTGVFEALACGIPLVCAPWDDAEHLFRPGEHYLVARNGAQMRELLAALRADPAAARAMAARGLQAIQARHTCRHRVDELLAIVAGLAATPAGAAPAG